MASVLMYNKKMKEISFPCNYTTEKMDKILLFDMLTDREFYQLSGISKLQHFGRGDSINTNTKETARISIEKWMEQQRNDIEQQLYHNMDKLTDEEFSRLLGATRKQYQICCKTRMGVRVQIARNNYSMNRFLLLHYKIDYYQLTSQLPSLNIQYLSPYIMYRILLLHHQKDNELTKQQLAPCFRDLFVLLDQGNRNEDMIKLCPYLIMKQHIICQSPVKLIKQESSCFIKQTKQNDNLLILLFHISHQIITLLFNLMTHMNKLLILLFHISHQIITLLFNLMTHMNNLYRLLFHIICQSPVKLIKQESSCFIKQTKQNDNLCPVCFCNTDILYALIPSGTILCKICAKRFGPRTKNILDPKTRVIITSKLRIYIN